MGAIRSFEAEDTAESTLKRLLGREFYRLHPAVQARFSADPGPDETITYEGEMETVHCSPAGWLFAQATRLIGNPLAAHRGRNVPMTVRLFPRPDGGVDWQRTYRFAGRPPFVVTSAKTHGAKAGLYEMVGFGFGMRLDVSARNGELHFVSRRYIWRLGGVEIPLPHVVSPGATHVIHADLGGGDFRFTITMDHPWLGRTFFQTGRFRRVAP